MSKNKHPRLFCVAPMMGYTTPYARTLYRILSKKTFLFTEMIASKAVIGLSESTSYHYVMGAGSPYIDYGGMRPENYVLFPEGSLNASYGTIVAVDKDELTEKLLNEALLNESVKN